MKREYLINCTTKYVQSEKEAYDSKLKYDPDVNIVSMNDNYANMDELYRVVDRDCIQFIDDCDALQDYLKRECEPDHNRSGIRLYRGQENASWVCRSTLLRDYRDYFSTKDQVITKPEFYFFLQHNLQLWDKMLSPKYFYGKTILKGLEKMPIKVKEYEKKMKERMLKANEDLRYELNAAWREITAQHYGLPTSLIDFTKDPYIALHFATIKYEEKESMSIQHKTLSDYFNILHFNTNNFILNWELHRDKRMKALMDSTNDKMYKDAFEAASMNYLINDDSSSLHDIDYPVYMDQTATGRPIENIRIKKQKGVLLSLGKYTHKCLEDAFKICSLKDDRMPKLHLTLIHHSLIAEIRRILIEKDITSKSLGFM